MAAVSLAEIIKEPLEQGTCSFVRRHYISPVRRASYQATWPLLSVHFNTGQASPLYEGNV